MDTYIYDTNILLKDPEFFLPNTFSHYGKCQIIIPRSVIDELDTLKTKEEQTGFQARQASRGLDLIISDSEKTNDAWEITPDCTMIIDEETDLRSTDNLHLRSYDDRILASTLKYQEKYQNKEDQKVHLVTLDRNLRVRAKSLDLDCVDPAGWFFMEENCYFFPFAEIGFRWSATEDNRYRLDLTLDDDNQIQILMWPYLGYPTGQFSTFHFRFIDPDHAASDSAASGTPMLILSTKEKINFQNQLGKISYQVVVPQQGQTYQLFYKKWLLDVSITRVEVQEAISEQEKARIKYQTMQAMNQAAYSADSSLMRVAGQIAGIAVGTSTSKKAIDKYLPYFSQLGFLVQIYPAADEAIERHIQRQEAEAKAAAKKKSRQTWTIIILVALIFGIPILFSMICFLLPLILF